MITLSQLLQEVEQLPTGEKWQLVRHILRSLEQEQIIQPGDLEWRGFLRETYGSLSDTPIQRWPQGEYEDRESLE